MRYGNQDKNGGTDMKRLNRFDVASLLLLLALMLTVGLHVGAPEKREDSEREVRITLAVTVLYAEVGDEVKIDGTLPARIIELYVPEGKGGTGKLILCANDGCIATVTCRGCVLQAGLLVGGAKYVAANQPLKLIGGASYLEGRVKSLIIE